MDKTNGDGDGVETENSFTLGVIEVAVSGPEEATSELAKLLPVWPKMAVGGLFSLVLRVLRSRVL